MYVEVWDTSHVVALPPIPKGGGKGGNAGGGNGGPKGGPKGGGKAAGKGGKASQICVTCGKTGRHKDRCWATYPELQRKKKVQAVDDGEIVIESICIGALDACEVCDTVPWAIVNRMELVQTTAASSDNLPVVGALLGTDTLL